MQDVTAQQQPCIALAAGGTGGHLFPAEALARELKEQGINTIIYTDARGARFSEALQGLDYKVVPARGLQGGLIGKVKAAVVIARAMILVRKDMKARNVSAIVGFGGYPSFAPVMAGQSKGLPVVVHEQGARLSLANRRLVHHASAIATSFPETAGIDDGLKTQVVFTGNPVRRSVLQARASYPVLSEESPLSLLVVGGSQGAKIFGDIVPAALVLLPEQIRRRLKLSLQYVGEDSETIVSELAALGITAELSPFFTDMGERLANAHVVIARAGATTAADLLVMGRPAIYVPIPQGGSKDEQLRNAQALEANGVGWCMPEDTMTAQALAEKLLALFQQPQLLTQTAEKAARAGRPEAAKTLAALVMKQLRKGRE